MLTHLTSLRRTPRLVITCAVTLAVAAVGLVGLATPAAAATGSYTITTWVQPQIPNTNIYQDGSVLNPPSTVPATATITTIQGHLNFTAQPSGMAYKAAFCIDTNDTMCAGVNPAATYTNDWDFTSAALSGKNASTTKLHLIAQLSYPSYVGVNPARYLTTARTLTVNYTY
jgi:hypothetical protein